MGLQACSQASPAALAGCLHSCLSQQGLPPAPAAPCLPACLLPCLPQEEEQQLRTQGLSKSGSSETIYMASGGPLPCIWAGSATAPGMQPAETCSNSGVPQQQPWTQCPPSCCLSDGCCCACLCLLLADGCCACCAPRFRCGAVPAHLLHARTAGVPAGPAGGLWGEPRCVFPA